MTATTDATLWAALSARYEAEHARAWKGIVARSRAGDTDRLDPLHTGAGIALIVNQLSYGVADEAEFLAGKVEPITAVLTQDGRGFVNEWASSHDDPPIDDWVYYERWEAPTADAPNGRRVAHGWIDPTTRRLLQSG